MYEEAVSHIWLATAPFWISIYSIWGKFCFLFYQRVVIDIYSNLKSFESLWQTFLIKRFKNSNFVLFSQIERSDVRNKSTGSTVQENSLLKKRKTIIGRKALSQKRGEKTPSLRAIPSAVQKEELLPLAHDLQLRTFRLWTEDKMRIRACENQRDFASNGF